MLLDSSKDAGIKISELELIVHVKFDAAILIITGELVEAATESRHDNCNSEDADVNQVLVGKFVQLETICDGTLDEFINRDVRATVGEHGGSGW